MFCLYCGDGLPEDAQFCRNCGKEQPAPGVIQTGTNAESVRLRPEQLEKRVQALSEEQRRLSNLTSPSFFGSGLTLCAAALALFIFCFLPYVSYNATNTSSIRSAYTFGDTLSPVAPSYNFTGIELTGLDSLFGDFGQGGPKDISVPSQSWLWLEPLVALLILLLAFFQIISSLYHRMLSANIAIGIGILALLTMLVMIFAQGRGSFAESIFFSYAAGGYWLFLGALLLALVGAILQLVETKSGSKGRA
ncbi:MAG TPA: zinc ribbon domain-containing protein [Ktedonosporobacter sp.]|nr:zinc ribbon domain-containing protein [Ktedonosporobacter sp.]